MRRDDYTFGDISDLLARDMGGLCGALGLKGAVVRGNQGRTMLPLNPSRADRNPGSFVVNLDTGRWNEYAPSNHPAGDALDLVALVKFGDPDSREARKHAFNWAKRWLGLGDVCALEGGTEKLARARDESARRKAEAEADLAANLAKKRRSAMAMWLNAQKLQKPEPGAKPSPAWRYFTEARGLPIWELKRLPSAVRWTAAARHVETDRVVPAIVSAFFMPGGNEVVAVHRIFLEPDGTEKIRVPHKGVAQKKIWPAGYMGAAIPISRGLSDLPIQVAADNGCVDDVFYCEGVEDGFTAALLAPEWRVLVVGAARNFEHQEPPACAGTVIVGRDNDPDPKVRKGVNASIGVLQARCQGRGLGFYVTAAKGAKDFNDMVRGG